nr:hypothetical protein [uncultured Solibaculum sp.]
MKKKIGIWLSIVLIAAVVVIATWGMLSQFRPTAGSDSSDFYATSAEVSSLPAPPPELQEGQYLLRHRAEIHTVTVSKDIWWQDQSNFSYTSLSDNRVDDTIEDLWHISVIPLKNTDAYRISIRQEEGTMQHEGGHAMSIMPASFVDFSFLLDSDGNLTWDNEETGGTASHAYILLDHALSGAIPSREEHAWETFPFFEVWDDASELHAQYSPSFQGNQLQFNIQYSQPFSEQYIISSNKSSQVNPILSEMFPGVLSELFYGNCQEANVQATASGTMTVDEKDALLSSTELTYSRDGYLIIPREQGNSFQRLDLSTQAEHSIEVTKIEKSSDMDSQAASR